MANYFYKKDEPLSPSGWVVIDETYRRGKILKRRRKKGFCTWCKKAVIKPKRFWCSQECVKAYCLTQPNELKKLVKKRDKTICFDCGLKCRVKSNWDMDHDVEISEGGHPFDLDNLKTLCINCHKIKTKNMYKKK